MASLCRWVSAAMSPRCSSFSAQRCLKSEGVHINGACVTAQALTYGPFRLLAMRVCLPRQFVVHLVETLDCARYAVSHFEMVAESPINRESRGCKLQTNRVSGPRRVLKKDILALKASTKASFHEPPVNFNFVHSLKSGGGDCKWRVVSTMLSGVESHRCKKSAANCRMHRGGIG